MMFRNSLILNSLLVVFLGTASCTGPKENLFGPFENQNWEKMRSGSEADAHKGYLKLADAYHRKGDYDAEAENLYNMAEVYLNQRDTLGMQRLLPRMKALWEAHPDRLSVGYSYYSVCQAASGLKSQETGRTDDIETMIADSRKSIEIMEKMSEEQLRKHHIMPVWNYYNLALAFDMLYDETQEVQLLDSMKRYLDKAEEDNRRRRVNRRDLFLEGEVSIQGLQAWLYYYEKDFDRAESQMLHVLELIDSADVITPNLVLAEKVDDYAFMADLYQQTGRMEEALRFQKLKNEADLLNMSVQRNAAVRAVEAQYNVAKEQAKVEHLRWILVTLTGIILLLIGAVLYLHLWRRNRMQMQYSAAVEALVNTNDEVSALTGNVSTEKAGKIFSAALKPLSAVERKYILLFMSGKSTEEIADAMHVAPTSVYTMKYRLRKKFPADFPLPF